MYKTVVRYFRQIALCLKFYAVITVTNLVLNGQ